MQTDSTEKARDVATSVFNSINLLAIKRSVRLLLELDKEVIEDFVKKYSGIMIFFLNILDQNRSFELVQKLTDSSIIYIIEEEIRFLLIREIALVSGDMEIIMELTVLMEHVDSPKPGEDADEGSSRVLSHLYETKRERKKLHFAYMDALGDQRRMVIIAMLLERNVHAAFSMLPYASEDVLCEITDAIADKRPHWIRLVPPEIINTRFHRDYSKLLKPGVFEHLPSEISSRIRELNQIKERYGAEFGEIDRILESKEPPAKKRDAVMNLAYKILKSINPDTHEMVLYEFKRRDLLADKEIYILREMVKQM